jgi:hypothetical protein
LQHRLERLGRSLLILGDGFLILVRDSRRSKCHVTAIKSVSMEVIEFKKHLRFVRLRQLCQRIAQFLATLQMQRDLVKLLIGGLRCRDFQFRRQGILVDNEELSKP